MTGTALALVATVVLVSLIVVLRSGRDAGTGNAAATPVAGSQETAVPPAASGRKPPTASPAATSGATAPAPSATTAPARTPPATTRRPGFRHGVIGGTDPARDHLSGNRHPLRRRDRRRRLPVRPER
ncbi:hypothetical protein ACFRFU_37110 [Streptomyces sp. NPDC056704]|uniref:hypothetical protein n=1 Tax=Streptomyces sp. NPDC056704 TaxID=3345917 RepID=UPI0036BEB87A